jgi:anti-sigma factor RsiW
MSTCPDDALLHVYLDDEIPPEYVGEYDSHAEKCPYCRKKLERIKLLRAAIKRDCQEIALSEKRLDAGYTRLMSNLRYRQVSRMIQKTQTPRLLTQILPLTAAAALVVSLSYFFLLDAQPDSQTLVSDTPRAEVPYDQSASLPRTLTITITSSGMTQTYNPGVMTAANQLPHIPDMDVFRPPFVYARTAYTAENAVRRVWESDVISFSLPEQESGE